MNSFLGVQKSGHIFEKTCVFQAFDQDKLDQKQKKDFEIPLFVEGNPLQEDRSSNKAR